MDELGIYYLKAPNKADIAMSGETKINKVKPLQLDNYYKPPPTPAIRAFEEKKTTEPWSKLVSDFYQVTSLHGIRYTTVDVGETVTRRVIWAFLVIGCMIASVYYLADRVAKYMKYEQSISVEENYVESMAFPAITICNQNLFSLTRAAAGDWYNVAKNLSSGGTSSADSGASKVVCGPSEFKCSYGSFPCISKDKLCDSFPDCPGLDDERNCTCKRLEISATPTYPELNDVTGIKFALQTNSYFSTRPVYMSENLSVPMFISYDDTTFHWLISKSYGKDTLVRSLSTAGTPQAVTSGWTVLSNSGGVQLQFSCSDPLFYNMSSNKNSDQSQPLDKLYKEAGQRKDELIMDCKWKGQNCNQHNFSETITDMGVCYTFGKQKLSVERPGPGSGLQVTMNIAFYDYTRSGASGVQILMHEPDDHPVMAGESLSVSPGLLSLVALERAQVENLAPPWGNCTKKKLKYYNNFTENTCKLECENVFARKNCSCRDYYMPDNEEDGYTVYCTASQYLNCLLPNMNTAKKNPKFCTCGLPCKNTVFVPSLSFATLVADTKSPQQSEQLSKIQNTLISAREEGYKVDEDRYREVARILNLGYLGLTLFQNFLSSLQGHVNESKAMLRDVSVLVGKDCHTLSSRHVAILNNIGPDLQRAINSFRYYYKASTYDSIVKFVDVVKTLRDGYNSTEVAFLHTRNGSLLFQQDNSSIDVDMVTMNVKNVSINVDMDYSNFNLTELLGTNLTEWLAMNITLPNGTQFATNIDVVVNSSILRAQNSSVTLPDEQFWNHSANIWIRFALLRVATQRSLSSVRLTSNKLVQQLEARLKAVADDDLVLQETLLKYVQPEVTTTCTWCSNSSNGSLVAILKDTLLTAVQSMKPKLLNMETMITTMYGNILKAMTANDSALWTEVITELSQLTTISEELNSKLETEIIVKLEEAMHFVDNLLQLFKLKCSVVSLMTQALDDNYEKTLSILNEMFQTVKTERQNFYDKSNLFARGTLSLSELANALDTTGKTDLVATRQSSLEDVLLDRKILIDGFQRKVNNVYFWSMTMWRYQYLTSNSNFWKKFGISNPGYTVPSSVPAIGDSSSSDLLVMKGTQSSQAFWSKLHDRIVSIVDYLKIQYASFTSVRNEGRTFFRSFIDGNTIGTSFFSSNYLKLDVYYKALTDKRVIQKKAYELPTLLSEVGGLMGLLVGASLITVFEWCDLFIYNGILKHREKRNEKEKNPPQ